MNIHRTNSINIESQQSGLRCILNALGGGPYQDMHYMKRGTHRNTVCFQGLDEKQITI